MTAIVPNRLHNIQALRGIAALLVVLSHIPSMESKHGGDKLLPDFFHLGISGVDLFFVISGFIMVYITWEVPGAMKTTAKFLFARVTRIYPLYWVIALGVFVMWRINPSLMTFDPEATNLLKSFMLWPDTTLPMLKVAWTLIHELYFYLIFGLILFLPHKLRLPGLMIWITALILGWHAGWSRFSPETALIFHPLSVEFFFGAVSGWLFKSYGGKFARVAILIGTILWIVPFAWLATGFDFSDISSFPTNWERVFYFGLPAAFIVYGLASIETTIRAPRWSVALGDWSYSLYLSHVLTISLIGYAWRMFAGPSLLDNIIMVPAMIIGSIISAAFCWYIVEKPLLNGSRHLRRKLFA